VYGEATIRNSNDQILTTSDYNNPYIFTGRRYDPETALYYYRARYYAPDIGRFLQTDPIGYLGGLNLYTYVGNNPIIFIDPYGLSFWSDLWKAKGLIGYGMIGIGGSVVLVATSPAWVTAGGVIAGTGIILAAWNIYDQGEMLEHPPGEDAFRDHVKQLEDLIDGDGDGPPKSPKPPKPPDTDDDDDEDDGDDDKKGS